MLSRWLTPTNIIAKLGRSGGSLKVAEKMERVGGGGPKRTNRTFTHIRLVGAAIVVRWLSLGQEDPGTGGGQRYMQQRNPEKNEVCWLSLTFSVLHASQAPGFTPKSITSSTTTTTTTTTSTTTSTTSKAEIDPATWRAGLRKTGSSSAVPDSAGSKDKDFDKLARSASSPWLAPERRQEVSVPKWKADYSGSRIWWVTGAKNILLMMCFFH